MNDAAAAAEAARSVTLLSFLNRESGASVASEIDTIIGPLGSAC
jgi:hypothetical protein